MWFTAAVKKFMRLTSLANFGVLQKQIFVTLTNITGSLVHKLHMVKTMGMPHMMQCTFTHTYFLCSQLLRSNFLDLCNFWAFPPYKFASSASILCSLVETTKSTNCQFLCHSASLLPPPHESYFSRTSKHLHVESRKKTSLDCQGCVITH